MSPVASSVATPSRAVLERGTELIGSCSRIHCQGIEMERSGTCADPSPGAEATMSVGPLQGRAGGTDAGLHRFRSRQAETVGMDIYAFDGQFAGAGKLFNGLALRDRAGRELRIRLEAIHEERRGRVFLVCYEETSRPGDSRNNLVTAARPPTASVPPVSAAPWRWPHALQEAQCVRAVGWLR